MIIKGKYKQLIARTILVVFLLNAVPKYILHDFFANHGHVTEQKQKHTGNQTRFETNTICDCEDLFVDVVYEQPSKNYFIITPTYQTVSASFAEQNSSSHIFSLNLRGPPTC